MSEQHELIKDFSYLVANEVEVETENPAIRAPKMVKVSAPFFETSDYLNGALNMDSGYCWSQTFTDIEIHVRIPDHIKSKQLKVNITPTSISVSAHIDGEWKTILDGTLSEKCKATDAMWTITGQKKLNINIDKMKDVWWERLFQNETIKVDVSRIDCLRPIEELPEETQAHLNQIQFDQRQRLKGELTSEQIKQHELLRKAWDADGSPFKGQPFDPNIVSFENSNAEE